MGFQNSARVRRVCIWSGDQVWPIRVQAKWEGHPRDWMLESKKVEGVHVEWQNPVGWGLHLCKWGGGGGDGKLVADRRIDQINEYVKDNEARFLSEKRGYQLDRN